MTKYDFKRYHIRAINAASEEEKASINQEMKDLYATLAEDEKVNFNEQLQYFLTHEYARLRSDYESIARS